ncbi:MAG: gamma-glutamyl-gamma-aminobutyrate hydrolase family protein [Clostridia bacterium]|nr:gamma-glutamyl-gamma-aminobutyrate hydrolase family protein [Clostridia bacterium]
MKKIIGISAGQYLMKDGVFSGFDRTYVNQDYVRSIIDAGGIPLILPLTDDIDIIRGYMDIIDGLVLSGGHDVSPLMYNEQPKPKLGPILVSRDLFDIQMVEEAMERHLPILGICRGHQILNVALGGTLYQDLSYKSDDILKHNQEQDPRTVSHEVKLTSNSILFDLFKAHRIGVNSYHHLAIKDLADGFKITAVSDDGVIEGIEHVDRDFVLGVQWHPEMMSSVDKEMAMLFKALVEAAEENSYES